MKDIFRALSSPTRREMLKVLFNEEIHITGLAKKVGISTPATIKHIKILEEAGLVHRRELGRMHLLRARTEKVFSLLEELQEPIPVEVEEGASVLDALRKVSGVSVSEAGDKEYVMAIDGEKGYFVYEVDGNILDLPMNQCKLEDNKQVKLKELVPVTRKNLEVKVKNHQKAEP
ncbi:MAG: ArsR/SmtB family transcription factor [Halobacteriota archaeon]